MDAAGQAPTPLDEGAVETILTAASTGQMTMHDAIGLGTDIVITADEVVGKALAWEEGVVHLSLFSTDRGDDGRVYGRGGRIQSPQARSSRAGRPWWQAPHEDQE
jgi:hypothetical protein